MKSAIFLLFAFTTIATVVESVRPNFPVLHKLSEIEAVFGGSTLQDCISEIVPKKCDEISRFERRPDGSCNNLRRDRIKFGAKDTALVRPIRNARYFDLERLDTPPNHPALKGFSQIPSADSVSRQLFEGQSLDDGSSPVGFLTMVFGQFLDHDMSLSPYNESRILTDCTQLSDFDHPKFPMFDFASFGTTCRSFFRARAVCQPQTQKGFPQTQREQVNVITSYIDGSNVYGSSEERQTELRDPDNAALMHVFKPVGFENEPRRHLLPIVPGPCIGGKCFEAGDERVNEHIGLQSMHTIFVREHNRIARELARIHRGDPEWTRDAIFRVAKRVNTMVMQKIAYKEFVPLLTHLGPYYGYNSRANAGIRDSFSTAAFRFGHSLIRNRWPLRNADFQRIGRQDIPLADAFFNPAELLTNGLENLAFGYLSVSSNDVDKNFANGIFRHLFLNTERSGSPLRNLRQSLISRNIHRGRDHGLRDYIRWRDQVGLRRDLSDIPKAKELLRVYRDRIRNIDVFVGGILERKVNGKLVGPLFGRIMKEQFSALRDGDRFYYENRDMYSFKERQQIEENASIARVMCDNLFGIKTIPKEPFKFNPNIANYVPCSQIPKMDLSVFTIDPIGKFRQPPLYY